MGHIELSREADLLVVAPATADLIARMAHGLAHDMATTALLATDKKTLIAPAMNLRMWLHPATQRNAALLANDGVLFVGPTAPATKHCRPGCSFITSRHASLASFAAATLISNAISSKP